MAGNGKTPKRANGLVHPEFPGNGWLSGLASICRPGEEAFVITSISVSAIAMPGKAGSELLYFGFALAAIGLSALIRKRP